MRPNHELIDAGVLDGPDHGCSPQLDSAFQGWSTSVEPRPELHPISGNPKTLSIIIPATVLLLWALLICGSCGPAINSTRSLKGRKKRRRRCSAVPHTTLLLWIIMHKQSKKNRGRLDLKQDEGQGKGHRQEGGYWPKLWKTKICRGVFRLRRTQNSPTESCEHWCFQAQDSGDIRKVKGPLRAELSCPGT